MTNYERMAQGLIYDPTDEGIMAEQVPFQDKLWEFNQLKPSEYEKKQRYMKDVFAECGENCYIELPFHANWGGHHVHFGSGIYANSNLTLVDDGHIYVGDKDDDRKLGRGGGEIRKGALRSREKIRTEEEIAAGVARETQFREYNRRRTIGRSGRGETNEFRNICTRIAKV